MKADVVNLRKDVVGEVELDDAIFGLEEVRVDLMKRVIDWQTAGARAGTHKVKSVGEVAGSGKKPFKQKGTGRARQGSIGAVQLRGGGVAHGPQVRSHAIKLQKKVRRLGMMHALSAKKAEGGLYIVDSLALSHPGTADLVNNLSNFGVGKFFIVDGNIVDNNLKLSAAALVNANVVPAVGANVYDIVNSDYVLISKDALMLLVERLR
jgi:large subunit ribosomal protein L4